MASIRPSTCSGTAQVRLGFLVEQEHPPAGPCQLRGGGQSRQPRAYHDRVCVLRLSKQVTGPYSSGAPDLGYHRLVPDQKLPVTEFDATRPHVARVYDYLLGGRFR
jgi:S-adenosyl methyltransferase